MPKADPRTTALAIADPYPLSFFNSKSLTEVNSTIQLWASEFDGDGVTANSIEQLRNLLPSKIEHNFVAKASHFAF